MRSDCYVKKAYCTLNHVMLSLVEELSKQLLTIKAFGMGGLLAGSRFLSHCVFSGGMKASSKSVR